MRMTRMRAEPRPSGYPSEYESVVGLSDGRKVRICPIVPSDAPELAEAIRTADSETLRARFLGAPPPLTDAVLARLTEVDYVTRFALIAHSKGRGVAIARYAAEQPAEDGSVTAEVAVAVAPEWRRVGLATVLIEELGRRALECGITNFSALYSAGNRPVAELARQGSARVVIDDGAAQLDALLGSPHDDWPRVEGRGRDTS
jgi:GNAT superfamily N-acetyltransferase